MTLAVGDSNKPKEKIYKLPWKRGEKTVVNNFIGIAGITEQEIFNQRQKSVSINDALWSLCNKYLLENQKIGNFNNIIALYYTMERIRVSENKSANYIVKRRLYFELLQRKEMGVNLAIVVCTNTSCEACQKLDGKEFDIDEAIKNQPLPPDNCTCLSCTCSF